MKSNKGFTLIELLAVIVILAIIALIATPIILGVIDTAKKGAAESSALGYIDAVEKQVMINEVEGTDAEKFALTGVLKYNVTQLGSKKVAVKGEKPGEASEVVIGTDGSVKYAKLMVNDFTVYYTEALGAEATKGSTVPTSYSAAAAETYSAYSA